MKAKKLLLLTAFTALGGLGIAQTVTHVHDWSLGRGGDGVESGEDIVVSSDEFNYTTGTFSGSVDFHPFSTTEGSVSSNGIFDVFICKRDKDGHFVWVKSFGGTSNDKVTAIDVDSESNIYVTGTFSGTVDFDPSPTSSFTLTQAGGGSIYVCKLDKDGTFIWAKQLKGTSTLRCTDLFVDGRDDVHITGYFRGQVDVNPAPPIFATHILNGIGSSHYNGFSVTLNENGIYQKSYHLKSSSTAVINAVYVDAAYNQFFTGYYVGTCDFDHSPSSTYNMSPAVSSSANAFIMRVDPFNGFQWAKQIESSSYSEPKGIEMDSNGNIYTVGIFFGTIDLNPGPGVDNHVKPPSSTSTYISKLATNGAYVYGKTISGAGSSPSAGNAYVEGLSVTNNGTVYLTGYCNNTVDFNPGIGTHLITAAGYYEAFVCALNPAGNLWSINTIEPHYSTGTVVNFAIDMSASEDVYTTGYFNLMGNFNPSGSPYYVICLGALDMFTHKLERYTPLVNPFFKSNVETENAEIDVFPNPTSNFINLRLKGEEDAQVSVTSMNGRVVYSAEHTNGLSSINLEHLSSGTYMLLVTQEEKTSRLKIVKQ